ANAATVSRSEVMAQEKEVTRIQAEITNLEATKRYLLGIGSSVHAGEPGPAGPSEPADSKKAPARPPIPEAYREKLQRTVNLDLDKATAAELVKAIGPDLFVVDRRAAEVLAMEEYRISLTTH